jgi:hypothetical protein
VFKRASHFKNMRQKQAENRKNNTAAEAAAGIVKDEQERKRKRPEAEKAIDTYSLLKSIQERARKITPTPYKLYTLNNNIRCALKQVYYCDFIFLYVRCLPL